MIDDIVSYYYFRGYKFPNTLEALIFAQTELGEAFDAVMRSGMMGEGWVRNNPDRNTSLAEELADAYMMINMAAHAMGVNVEDVLRAKFEAKGWTQDWDHAIVLQRVAMSTLFGAEADAIRRLQDVLPQSTSVLKDQLSDAVSIAIPKRDLTPEIRDLAFAAGFDIKPSPGVKK